jgi:protease-4
MEKMKDKYFLTIATRILGLCLFLASGCSFISVSLIPPVEPLMETTVMGKGKEKVLIVEISGIISEEGAP